MDRLRTLIDGIALGESPRWHQSRLWFSDWGAGEIVAADLDGRCEVVARVAARPFSIDWLPDGRMLVVTGGGRLLRREPDGALAPHADLAGLSGRSWNEIVVDPRGSVYVNAIGFDFPAGEFAPGTIAVIGADGSTSRAAEGLSFPNGMAITPDGSTLIVAESYGKRLTAFDIGADGTLSHRRVWADLDGGVPDGICLDAEGAVWYADVPHQRCTRVREGGEVLQTLALDRGCFACMLGGSDGRMLFMMAARWGGAMASPGGARTGQVLIALAPAPHAGKP